MKTISKETLAKLRERYPAGTRVELVRMDDPYTSLTAGDKGTVISVISLTSVSTASLSVPKRLKSLKSNKL